MSVKCIVSICVHTEDQKHSAEFNRSVELPCRPNIGDEFDVLGEGDGIFVERVIIGIGEPLLVELQEFRFHDLVAFKIFKSEIMSLGWDYEPI